MMKVKSNQTRTYDGDGFKKRAACLCFRSCSEEEVLLVSSSRHPDKWIVPGGGMEPEEEPSVAAAREVCEEVGSFLIYYLIMAPFRFVDGSTL
uniref:Nudix hydrolase domain-containing protein n=1 Tax=Gadus morhua TaxID=8049 RepID=A0A8C5A440_GADMO